MKRLVLLGAIAAVLLVAAPPPSPVHVSYVTSDSMAPSLETGDVYLVVDSGAPAEGDVVVFDAETRDGYTTHRVVGQTAAGYVTQGDANPTTDQAGGEPPVTRDRILGTVPAVGGQPLAVPVVGSGITAVGTSGLSGLAGMLAVVWGLKRVGASTPGRPAVTARSIFVPVAVGLLLVGGVTVALAPSTTTITYTAVDFDSPAPDAVPVGESTTEERTIEVRETGFTHVVIDVDGADATVRERDGTTRTVELVVPAREEPGSFDVEITVAPYPNTLPGETIESLHAVHPVAAVSGTVGAVFVPFAVLYWLLIDGRTLLRAPLSRRLQQWGGRR